MNLRFGTTPRPSAVLAADDRGLGFALLGLAPGLLLALLGALTFATGPAQASFPGSNGKIACTGPLGPNPPPTGQSFLEVFTINPDGSGETRLTTNTVAEVDPTFSADGTKFVFIRDNDVWKMNADGTNPVQLTTGGTTDRVGGWSPDGSQIVYQKIVDHSPGVSSFEIFKMNADGTNQVNLTNNPGSATVGSNDSQPSWSPDGSRIAFHSNRLGNSNIHTMNATDGSDVRVLTADSLAEESAPEYSPDGQQIAFQSDRGFVPRPGVGRNLEIYRINANDGSNVTRLTFNDFNPTATGTNTTGNLTGFDLEPYWSPAGDRIVFHSGRNDAFGAAQWDVYTVGAVNGENPIGGAPAVQVTNRANNDFRCSWGPVIPFNLLSVAKAGSGEGTVTSNLPGIDCGVDCAQGHAPGTVVTLTAAPAANGSTFTGFTGCNSTTATTCTVTMSAAKNVTATFADLSPALTVTKLGSGTTGKASTGEGTVTSSPVGIDCGADCTQEYAAGTSVTLTADAGPGSTFSGFSGPCDSTTPTTCTVAVNRAKTVTATFGGPLLSVTKTGTGADSLLSRVSSAPLGVSCGLDCSEDYTAGSVVTLTAAASTSTVAGGFGATFTGFTGCDSTTATTCTVTMNQAKTVTATFVDFPTLTVTKMGAGTGTVTSTPAGLACGTTCTRDFAKDSSVTLTAAPAAGSTFSGFIGCATTPTATTCTVTLDQARAVLATFGLTPPEPPPPPPPPADDPPAAAPPPPPAASLARAKGSLSATVTPARALRAPFVMRTTGRLTRPAGVSAAEGCNGNVSVQVKGGRSNGVTVSNRRVRLSSTCTFSLRVSFGNMRRFGTATRLKVTARFLGNARVLPDAAGVRYVRVR